LYCSYFQHSALEDDIGDNTSVACHDGNNKVAAADNTHTSMKEYCTLETFFSKATGYGSVNWFN